MLQDSSDSEGEDENDPNYIVEALNNGFDVEIDVWYKHGDVWLGHDNPTYPVDVQFIQLPMFWCHAKNLDALHYMIDADINCFWHQDDERTLTRKGFIAIANKLPEAQKNVHLLLRCNSHKFGAQLTVVKAVNQTLGHSSGCVLQ